MLMARDKAERRPFAPLGPERSHYWRVLRMARATGTDLGAAMSEGRLSQTDWADMVTRCRGCTWVNGCGRWLDRTAPDDTPHDAPPGCLNRARFAALRADQTEDTT